MKNMMVIYNDTSGNNQGEKIAKQFSDYLKEEKINCNVVLQVTNADIDPDEIRQNAKQNQIDTLVIIGGDGTIHHVLETFKGSLSKLAIGIIPGGTVNNFVRSLNIPVDQQSAFEVIKEAKTCGVDYGLVNNKVMISTLTIGLLADTGARVTQTEKQKLGPLAFAKRFIEILAKQRRYKLSIETSVGDWHGKAQLVTVTMTNSAGGFTNFDTLATPDDGLFHITILPKLHILKLLRAIPKIIQGKLAEIDGVVYLSAAKVSMTSPDKKVRTRTDGDPTDNLPIEMQVVHNGLNIFVPEGELPNGTIK